MMHLFSNTVTKARDYYADIKKYIFRFNLIHTTYLTCLLQVTH